MSEAQAQLTGSRIRQRRLDRKLRQAELAQIVGISPSYLNLIEHDRRRIGGKLLIEIARALEVESALLTEGAASGLVSALGAAAANAPDVACEIERVEEFAGRFPGWAGLVAAQAVRLEAQERSLEALNDRLTHDPFLQTSLHDVLSTVTAIRSTAAILNEGEEIDENWRLRFHRNIYEDSQRLAESSQALVSYFEAEANTDRGQIAPLEEVDEWFAARDWSPDAPWSERRDAAAFSTKAGRALAKKWLATFRADEAILPRAEFTSVRAALGDPVAMAAHFDCDLAAVFRRWAILSGSDEVGLVVCDGSGTPTLRKSALGFVTPPYGAGCPLWPLYSVLSTPGVPVRAAIEQAGRRPQPCLAYAVARQTRPLGYEGPVLTEATMLILPDPPEQLAVVSVGPSCRICPRDGCVARREPSILGEA